MAKLGYTFYPKDWGNSESVFELNLAERGLYRELIDMAMLNDNETEIKLEVWSRKFAVSIDELNQILEKLSSLKLIEINEKSLFVPSCENRLNLSRAGKKSKPSEASKNNLKQEKNKPTPKPISEPFSKPYSEQREKEIESEIEKEIEDEIKNNDDNFLNFKILILKKISENKIDFENEIAICQEKCENSKNREEEEFHENCIKFLTIEKNKKKPPDKENNTTFSELLKKDEDWIEDMARAFKKPQNYFFVKLDEFVMHLNTDKKIHLTENEFRKHFKAWLPYNLQIKNTSETVAETGFSKNR